MILAPKGPAFNKCFQIFFLPVHQRFYCQCWSWWGKHAPILRLTSICVNFFTFEVVGTLASFECWSLFQRFVISHQPDLSKTNPLVTSTFLTLLHSLLFHTVNSIMHLNDSSTLIYISRSKTFHSHCWLYINASFPLHLEKFTFSLLSVPTVESTSTIIVIRLLSSLAIMVTG